MLVHRGRIIGRGHNRRVQQGSAIRHGEMDALENAGRQPASVYRESVIYTTLSPCAMCSGAILLYGIPRVVVGENQTFLGEEALLRARGVSVEVVQDPRCIELMAAFIAGESGDCGTRTSAADGGCRSCLEVGSAAAKQLQRCAGGRQDRTLSRIHRRAR